ncbi:GDP-mannose-dependent alpha-(1-6)-phosphatidylinositol monomannoside mannosyltransferase [bacterium HR08]|nr:GDP-mannose-dependent alpha-(1-6)-phosphatidylinositol monomannoside mannosyltransferase [bacterium HR08]
MPEILVLATDAQTRGGIQRYVRHLVESLRALCGPQAVRVLFLWRTTAPPSFREKLAFVRSGIGEVRRRPPSLILSTHVGIARVAAVMKRIWGIPYLVLAHGDEVWGSAPSYALRAADVVLSISRFTAERLIRRHGVEAQKIQLLPPALDPEFLRSPVSPQQVVERHGLRGKRVLLTVSRLTARGRYKGHEVVMRALVQVRRVLPEVVYVIVGDGDDRPRLERLAIELGLGEAVHFAGDVDDAWLAAYYRSCDLFVMPSRTRLEDPCEGEGFGIAYLEAAAFGKPAIAGREGGGAEAVLDGVTGVLVNAADPEEVARAILELLQDEAQRQSLGERARERAWRDFTLERFRQNVAAILRRVMPAEGRGGGPCRAIVHPSDDGDADAHFEDHTLLLSGSGWRGDESDGHSPRARVGSPRA